MMIDELNLKTAELTANLQLLAQIPHDLATYYQVVPLERLGDHVCVVMAHPENSAALAILSGLFNAHITALPGDPQQIRGVLEQLRPAEWQISPRILAWSGASEWQTAVTQWASLFSEVLLAPVTVIQEPHTSPEDLLTAARQGQYSFTIAPFPPDAHLHLFLNQATTPVLLVRGLHQELWRILVVMRGYSSDEYTLDWIVPFAWRNNTAVTLLPLSDPPVSTLHELQQLDAHRKQHLDLCLYRLSSDAVQAQVRFRPGTLVEQVMTEVTYGNYDLVVIAAEAQGKFVSNVLLEMNHQGLHGGRPVLIIKPFNP